MEAPSSETSGATRYLVTRTTVPYSQADTFRRLSGETLATITEVHPTDKIGMVGTYSIDLSGNQIAEFAGSSNLISMQRIGQYALGYSKEAQVVSEERAGQAANLRPHLEALPPPLPPDPAGQGPEVYQWSLEAGARQNLERYYRVPKALDQGRQSACTGFSAAHFLGTAPIMTKVANEVGLSIYKRAKEIDEWPGTNYEGSSVEAACQVLVERGYIKGFGYLANVEDMYQWILHEGGLCFGTDWHEGMIVPNATGYLRPTGRLVGGHAYFIRGMNRYRDVRILNSWGMGWGYHGLAWIARADVEFLFRDAYARCAAMIQEKAT